MSSELAAIDWLGRGWLLLLAFTVAVLAVAALRKPCRRLFGTERAFQLWLLPLLAVLASQLPHAANADRAPLPALVYAVTSAVGANPAIAAAPATIDWRDGAALAWLAGIVVSLMLAALAQLRYRSRLRGATPMADALLTWPVLRAVYADVGPALVGAWHVRIVLPADFEHRYDDAERALIIAHEAMHARRRDGWWCLVARSVAALFWFHPLAWWALGALRHDQELACDAAVLREHGRQRRSYANAMLKTQSAQLALPVGCSWSPRHPLTERIAMLKLPSPNRQRRNLGTIAGSALAIVIAGSITRSSSSPKRPPSPACGFSPATAIRASSIPHQCFSACARCSIARKTHPMFSTPGTSAIPMWTVASATRSSPAANIIVGCSTPNASAIFSVCPGRRYPASCQLVL